MKNKFFPMLVLSAVITLGAALTPNSVFATSTEDKYQQSQIVMVTRKNGVPFYAEPGKDSLTLGFYPKGTIFVPIKQQRNTIENKVYNLCIRFDGAVGWLSSDDVSLSRK